MQGQTAVKAEEEEKEMENETKEPVGCLDQASFQEAASNIEYKKLSRSRTASKKRKRQTRMKEELAKCKSPGISGDDAW